MDESKPSTLDPSSLIRSVFRFSLSTWISAVLYLITLVLVTYLFADASGVYGTHTIFFNAANTVMCIAALGLDFAYIRFYNEPPDGIKSSRQLAFICMVLSFIFLGLLALVICLIFPAPLYALLIGNESSADIAMPQVRFLVYLCVQAAFLLLSRFFSITYRMQLNARMYNIQNLLLTFFARMFFLVGALISVNLEFLIRFDLIGLGAFVLVFFFLQRRQMLPEKPALNLRGTGTLFRYGLALTPSSIILYANSLSSSLILKAFADPGQLDILAFLTYASLALSIVQVGFANFWGAFMFGNYKTEQRKIKRVHEYICFIILSLMAFLIIIQPLAFGLLGQRFREGQTLFGLMLFAPMLLIVSETTVYGIDISNKTIHHSIGNALCAAANIGICFMLVPTLGISGVALAQAVSGLILFVYRTLVAQKHYASMDRPVRTLAALSIMATLSVSSWLLASHPAWVSALAAMVMAVFTLLYRQELKKCISVAWGILKSLTTTRFQDKR